MASEKDDVFLVGRERLNEEWPSLRPLRVVVHSGSEEAHRFGGEGGPKTRFADFVIDLHWFGDPRILLDLALCATGAVKCLLGGMHWRSIVNCLNFVADILR